MSIGRWLHAALQAMSDRLQFTGTPDPDRRRWPVAVPNVTSPPTAP